MVRREWSKTSSDSTNIRRASGRQPLEAAGDLVGQEADGAADEAWQAGQSGHRVAAEQAVDQLQRVVVGEGAVAVGRFQGGVAALADVEHLAGAGADERVAADVLDALDALQQEGVAAGGVLQVGRDGGFEVGQDLAVHRHEAGGADEGARLLQGRGISWFHQAPRSLKKLRPMASRTRRIVSSASARVLRLPSTTISSTRPGCASAVARRSRIGSKKFSKAAISFRFTS